MKYMEKLFNPSRCENLSPENKMLVRDLWVPCHVGTKHVFVETNLCSKILAGIIPREAVYHDNVDGKDYVKWGGWAIDNDECFAQLHEWSADEEL